MSAPTTAPVLVSEASPQPGRFYRASIRGKFLFCGDEKFYVRGVTYGPFRPATNGNEFPDLEVVEQDFATMAANCINTVRLYNVPPRWFLDTAQRYGLRVMVGLPWEQHVAFLDDQEVERSVKERVRNGVHACAGHPAVLLYAIGNEIPASIVRWHGARRIEKFVRELYEIGRAEDPEGVFTYVNYPSTEYLELPFLDVCCFNVYLEEQDRLEAYLARLQNLIGDRPLLLTEIGFDSRRHGLQQQGQALGWQIRTAFAAGCAGACVFAWTDQWYREGCDIEDWDFGLTDRSRRPKPALVPVRRAFEQSPFLSQMEWPRISVIVCTYNGNDRLLECFRHLKELAYPNFEVIVVDDGSTTPIAEGAPHFGFRLIRTHNAGLSSARNTGLRAATGEIVAYLDDDAYPDTDWLKYLAATFSSGDYAGVGGPNIPPPGDGWVADCVSNSPGGPIHVLLTDREAEHIPGCNMAFCKSALLAIGGFDERFRVAGDDVDVCWSLQAQGYKLGFSPAAVVWHHRRNSVRTYWRQQRGYGRAEALLEKKWPDKYNAAGHVSWAGKVYGNGFHTVLPPAGRIYHGQWASAPFQRLYTNGSGMLSSVMLLPEWFLVVALLGCISLAGLFWKPLLVALPLCGLAVTAPVLHALASGWRARSATAPLSRLEAVRLRSVTALLHVLQPLARLFGRIHFGLTLWRRHSKAPASWPRTMSYLLWSEDWQDMHDRLRSLEDALRGQGAAVRRGGDFDDWDLQVRGGPLGSARARIAVEEHGQGRQLVRVRLWPRYSGAGIALAVGLGTLAVGAAAQGQAWVAGAMGLAGLVLISRSLDDTASASHLVCDACKRSGYNNHR